MFRKNASIDKKKVLLAEKERILQEIKYYEKRIDEFSNTTSSIYYGGDSSDSEDGLPPVVEAGGSSAALRRAERRLRTRLQATQELSALAVLQSEVNVLVQPPEMQGEKAVSEPGLWREVMAECRIDLVPFSITFFTHQPERRWGAVSFRGLRVLPVKAAQEAELAGSELPALAHPADAVEVVRSYASAYRSRRATLARLAAAHATALHMTPLAGGGLALRCGRALRLRWRLHARPAAAAAFQHKMDFQLDYMDETHLKAIKLAHEQLADPSLQTDDRTALLQQIISTCLQAAGDTLHSHPDSNEKTIIRDDDDVDDERKRDDEVMAPPKAIPKKSKPKGKENKDDNRRSVKRGSSQDASAAKKARTDGEHPEGRKEAINDAEHGKNTKQIVEEKDDEVGTKTLAKDKPDVARENASKKMDKNCKAGPGSVAGTRDVTQKKSDVKTLKKTNESEKIASQNSKVAKAAKNGETKQPDSKGKSTKTKAKPTGPEKDEIDPKNPKNMQNTKQVDKQKENSKTNAKEQLDAKKSTSNDPAKKKTGNSDPAPAQKVHSDSATTKKTVNSDPVHKKTVNSDLTNSNNVNSDPVNKKTVNSAVTKKTVNSGPANKKTLSSVSANTKIVNSVTANKKAVSDLVNAKKTNSVPVNAKTSINSDSANTKKMGISEPANKKTVIDPVNKKSINSVSDNKLNSNPTNTKKTSLTMKNATKFTKNTTNAKNSPKTAKESNIIKNKETKSFAKTVKERIQSHRRSLGAGGAGGGRRAGESRLPRVKLSPAYAAVLQQNPLRISPRVTSKLKSSSDSGEQSKQCKPLTSIPRLLKKAAPKSK